jgi:hypothetical protein
MDILYCMYECIGTYCTVSPEKTSQNMTNYVVAESGGMERHPFAYSSLYLFHLIVVNKAANTPSH